MKIHLCIRNDSKRTRLYRQDDLVKIAERICTGEGLSGEAELSVLFCDDGFIRDLNRTYRKRDYPTDVLAFCQGGSRPDQIAMLGDIVISLETVERHCIKPGGPDREAQHHAAQRRAMRDEVRLLFSHALLHLLGYCHSSAGGRKRMADKQAHYLGITAEAAWPASADKPPSRSRALRPAARPKARM